jgi:hypothetical protein
MAGSLVEERATCPTNIGRSTFFERLDTVFNTEMEDEDD